MTLRSRMHDFADGLDDEAMRKAIIAIIDDCPEREDDDPSYNLDKLSSSVIPNYLSDEEEADFNKLFQAMDKYEEKLANYISASYPYPKWVKEDIDVVHRSLAFLACRLAEDITGYSHASDLYDDGNLHFDLERIKLLFSNKVGTEVSSVKAPSDLLGDAFGCAMAAGLWTKDLETFSKITRSIQFSQFIGYETTRYEG